MVESRMDKQKTICEGLLVPVSALLIGLCLGSGYGWSIFVNPLMDQHGWSLTQVTLTCSLALFFQGLSCLLIGNLADRHPRTMAVVGGTIFGMNFILAGLFAHYGYLILIYLCYGVICGFSSGIPYLSALCAAVKWFPRHCGMISGISVTGVGMGAVLIGLFAPPLILRFGPGITLMGMGGIFLLICGGLGFSIRNPPRLVQQASDAYERKAVLPWDALRQGKFWGLWFTLFISISAGIAIFTQAAPMAQDLQHMSSLAAGKLVAMMAICNGLGRLFWSSLSDKIGRPKIFLILFGTEACVFLSLVQITNVWWFGAAFCYITFCYGGAIGTMPAFTADLFGGTNLGRVYGPIMFAQSIAGFAGPMLYSMLREYTGAYILSTRITGFVLILACSLPLIMVNVSSSQAKENQALFSSQENCKGMQINSLIRKMLTLSTGRFRALIELFGQHETIRKGQDHE